MLDHYVASDLARRRMKDSLEPRRPVAPKPELERGKRGAVRASSAAALRGLADRLEPSPSA